MLTKEVIVFKKIMILALGLIITASFTSTCLAGSKANKRKGKFAYRMTYQACYDRGEVKSVKPPISPDDKTQAQWKRVFDKKRFDQFGCKEDWDTLTEKDLLNVYTYLHAHAADSPSPAKCE